jgi:hypothetical protein
VNDCSLQIKVDPNIDPHNGLQIGFQSDRYIQVGADFALQ